MEKEDHEGEQPLEKGGLERKGHKLQGEGGLNHIAEAPRET
jgi:hypothetical protein